MKYLLIGRNRHESVDHTFEVLSDREQAEYFQLEAIKSHNTDWKFRIEEQSDDQSIA